MKRLFVFLVFVSISFGQTKFPELKYYANDYTNTLSGRQMSALNQRLKTFDDTTSNQIVMLMIPTLDGYPLEEYANETAIQNKIGTKKNDNGILLLVVKNDRKVRIEVGYGLEGALPDALASSIIRNVMIPYFKSGDYYGGISAGISAIILATKGEYKADRRASRNNSSKGLVTFLIMLFIIISFFFRGGRRGGIGSFIFWSGVGAGTFGGRSGGGGFGGGGGFSGGGFSGGGGSFGGGGASGGW